MDPRKIKQIVEAALLCADGPMSLDAIVTLFRDEDFEGGAIDRDLVRESVNALVDDCEDRGFELKKVASGYRLQIKLELSTWVGRMWEEKPPRYSRALLETLALVAYRQPVTRGDIEQVRGVAVSTNIIRTLVERNWVRVVGHRDVPGRPAMYGTTRAFLDYFNVKNLAELPSLAEIRSLTEPLVQVEGDSEYIPRPSLELPSEADMDSDAGTEESSAQDQELSEESTRMPPEQADVAAGSENLEVEMPEEQEAGMTMADIVVLPGTVLAAEE